LSVRRLMIALLGAATISGSSQGIAAPSAGPPGPGISRVAGGAILYAPSHVQANAPLIVLLHGAGGNAREFLNRFKGDADRTGALLLSLQSTGRTWPQSRRAIGAENSKIDAAVMEVLARASVDRRRVIALGFSDGASYALTLALAKPDVFRGVVALSPGYAFAPPRVDSKQRIFITHGRRDTVLPFTNVRDQLVPALERVGYHPQVRWFNGGHVIDPDALQAGISYALGRTVTPS
jgi:phospholipase/carboxylesterase